MKKQSYRNWLLGGPAMRALAGVHIPGSDYFAPRVIAPPQSAQQPEPATDDA